MPGQSPQRAEVHDSRHAAAVIGARLRVVDDGIDDVHSAAALFNVYARNIAVAVILDIDGNVALGADLLNDLAAGADDLADLSTGTTVDSIFGAYLESSGRGSAITGSITSSRM